MLLAIDVGNTNVHAEIGDEGQTVSIVPAPEIGTTAVDADDLDHEAEADSKVEIRDVVTYKGLTPGRTYVLTGTLMDKATGEPVQFGGKDVTAKTTFAPEKADGSATVTFSFDGSALSRFRPQSLCIKLQEPRLDTG